MAGWVTGPCSSSLRREESCFGDSFRRWRARLQRPPEGGSEATDGRRGAGANVSIQGFREGPRRRRRAGREESFPEGISQCASACGFMVWQTPRGFPRLPQRILAPFGTGSDFWNLRPATAILAHTKPWKSGRPSMLTLSLQKSSYHLRLERFCNGPCPRKTPPMQDLTQGAIQRQALRKLQTPCRQGLSLNSYGFFYATGGLTLILN